MGRSVDGTDGEDAPGVPAQQRRRAPISQGEAFLLPPSPSLLGVCCRDTGRVGNSDCYVNELFTNFCVIVVGLDSCKSCASHLVYISGVNCGWIEPNIFFCTEYLL